MRVSHKRQIYLLFAVVHFLPATLFSNASPCLRTSKFMRYLETEEQLNKVASEFESRGIQLSRGSQEDTNQTQSLKVKSLREVEDILSREDQTSSPLIQRQEELESGLIKFVQEFDMSSGLVTFRPFVSGIRNLIEVYGIDNIKQRILGFTFTYGVRGKESDFSHLRVDILLSSDRDLYPGENTAFDRNNRPIVGQFARSKLFGPEGLAKNRIQPFRLIDARVGGSESNISP